MMLEFEDRQAAFVAGYELGLAHRCNIDTTQADYAVTHARLKPGIDAIIRDMSQRGPGAYADIERRRRARQLEAHALVLAASRPWPPETPNPSARVLNGWPDPPRRAT
jgi:hypothetical protein